MACNAPSYPPPSSGGGWGDDWGQSWSSSSGGNTWDVTQCVIAEYVVTPILLISYSVPIILGISYDVQYASPLIIDCFVSQPLTVAYSVPAILGVGYTVPVTAPLLVTYTISRPLRVEFTVSKTAPLNISYTILHTASVVVSFEVLQSLIASYRVPDAAAVLDISYTLDPAARAMVINYDVGKTYGMFIFYAAGPSHYYQDNWIVYQVTNSHASSPLAITFSVDDAAGSGSAYGSSAAMMKSFSINGSNGSISINAVVTDSHPWASASVGGSVSGFIAGRQISFIVKSITYDKANCLYKISGTHTSSEFLDAVIDDHSGIWVEDPVRKKRDAGGKICEGDLKLRDGVWRPTVESAIHAAASKVGVSIVLDHSIPGLDGLVPFDAFYGTKELTLGDVINKLIGWAKPFFFMGDGILRIVGGRPPQAVGLPPTAGDFVSRTVRDVELPSAVEVNGGLWPKSSQGQQGGGAVTVTGCAAEYSDSESDDYVLHDTVTTPVSIAEAHLTVLRKVIEKRMHKVGGVVVGESEHVYFDYIVPIVVGSEIAGYRNERALAEKTITTYSYLNGCPSALLEKKSVTYRPSKRLVESPLWMAIYEDGNAANRQIVYRASTVSNSWSCKGYLERSVESEYSLRYITDVSDVYDSRVKVEYWKPLGDGLWYHSASRTVGGLTEIELENEVAVDSWIVGDHSTVRTETEITDSGPLSSNCASGDNVLGCTSVGINHGLERCHETVNIGGTLRSTSITVPSVNLYWPISGAPSTPPDCSEYANYAARAQKISGSVTFRFAVCAGDRALVEKDAIALSTYPIPGEFVGGGMVTSVSVDGSNDGSRGSYTVSYFA